MVVSHWQGSGTVLVPDFDPAGVFRSQFAAELKKSCFFLVSYDIISGRVTSDMQESRKEKDIFTVTVFTSAGLMTSSHFGSV